MATAGRISIFLNAVTKGFDDGIGRVQKGIRNLTKGFADINGFISLAQQAFGQAQKAAEAFADEIERLDDLVDTANRLNLTADSLQKFHRAAEIASGDVESMNKGLATFNRVLGDAAMGQSGPSKALARLGLDAKELSQMGLDQAFTRVLEKLGKIPNAAERASIGADLFGKSAMNLTDFMANGANAIQQATNDLNQFGVSLNGRVDDIDKAKRSMEQLKMATGGLVTELTLAAAPTMTNFMRGTSMSIAAARNMDLGNVALSAGPGLLSPGAVDFFGLRNEFGRAAVRSMTSGSFSNTSSPPLQVSSGARSRGFFDNMASAFIEAIHTPNRVRNIGAAVDPDSQRFLRAMRFASLAEFDRQTLSAPGGAGALEFGSAAAFSAVQQSRREDEMRRLQKQEVDESKKQTKLLEDIHRDGLGVFVAGLQG